MRSNRSMEVMYYQLNLRHSAGVSLGVSLHSAPDSQSALPPNPPKPRPGSDKEEAEPRDICSDDGINVIALEAHVVQFLQTD